MKKNIGITDKGIRFSIAAIIIILAFAKLITGTTAIILIILAVVLALTSLVSFCPLYSVLRVSTKKKEK